MKNQATEELKIEVKSSVSCCQKQSIIIKIKAPANYLVKGKILSQNCKYETIENFIKNHSEEGINNYMKKAKEVLSKVLR